MSLRIILFVLCFSLTFSYAQDERLSLDEFIDMGLKTNLKLISSELNKKMFSQESRINSALPDAKFMIEGRRIPMDLSQFGQTQEVMFMIEQMFPFPGKLDAMAQKGEFITTIQAELKNAVKIDLTRNISQLYYKLAFLDNAIDINQQHIKLISTITKVVQSKYVVGKALQQDVNRIKIESKKFEAKNYSLVKERQNSAIKMNRLLNRQLDTKITEIELPKQIVQLSSEKIDSLIVLSNPFAKIAKLKIQSSGNDIRLAKLGNKPDLMLMGGYMAMNSMDDMYMGRVALTLPFLPWSNKDTKAQVEKAILFNQKEANDFKDIVENLLSFSKELVNSLASLNERIMLYDDEIVPLSEQTVVLSLNNYQTNTLDFLTLVSYSRELLNNKLDSLMLWDQYYQKLAELERIVGIRFNF
jgi:outer membrane protein, heavy metal efflux system